MQVYDFCLCLLCDTKSAFLRVFVSYSFHRWLYGSLGVAFPPASHALLYLFHFGVSGSVHCLLTPSMDWAFLLFAYTCVLMLLIMLFVCLCDVFVPRFDFLVCLISFHYYLQGIYTGFFKRKGYANFGITGMVGLLSVCVWLFIDFEQLCVIWLFMTFFFFSSRISFFSFYFFDGNILGIWTLEIYQVGFIAFLRFELLLLLPSFIIIFITCTKCYTLLLPFIFHLLFFYLWFLLGNIRTFNTTYPPILLHSPYLISLSELLNP